MKKLILFIAFIAITTMTFAQDNRSYIEVTGIVEFEKPVKKYIAKVIVAKELIYDSHEGSSTETSATTIDALTDKYFKKLTAVNFDTKKLNEDKFGYLTTGFRKEGKLFIFETTSVKEYVKLLSVNLDGIQIYNRYAVYKLSTNAATEIAKQAIENAKQKAKLVANSSNKKIGDIIVISDNNQNESKEVLYYDNLDDKGLYQVIVRFELL